MFFIGGFFAPEREDKTKQVLHNLSGPLVSQAEIYPAQKSGNALGAFLQTRATVLDKISGPMGARFLSSTGQPAPKYHTKGCSRPGART